MCAWVPVYGVHIAFAPFSGAVGTFWRENGAESGAESVHILVPCEGSKELHKLSQLNKPS